MNVFSYDAFFGPRIKLIISQTTSGCSKCYTKYLMLVKKALRMWQCLNVVAHLKGFISKHLLWHCIVSFIITNDFGFPHSGFLTTGTSPLFQIFVKTYFQPLGSSNLYLTWPMWIGTIGIIISYIYKSNLTHFSGDTQH